jgi:hypothetical protein
LNQSLLKRGAAGFAAVAGFFVARLVVALGRGLEDWAVEPGAATAGLAPRGETW